MKQMKSAVSETTNGGVDLGGLREEFEFALNERESSVFGRARLNWEARNCVWPGQSEDGRKWSAHGGEDEVFPWPGASDAKVMLMDKYIRLDAATLLVLWERMKAQVHATESSDEGWAQRMTTLLRWMKYTQMRENYGETELLLNYLLERGAGVKGVFWCKRSQLMYHELDLEGVAILCAQRSGMLAAQQQQAGNLATDSTDGTDGGQPDPRFLELPSMILDPSRDEESAPLLWELIESDGQGATAGDGNGPAYRAAGALPARHEGSKRLERVLSELRVNGYARVARAVVGMNRPKVVAYCPNEDIFLSPDAQNGLEDGAVHVVRIVREARLRAEGRDYGWDEAWVEGMVESQRGNLDFGGLRFSSGARSGLAQNAMGIAMRGELANRKSFLIVESYRRLVDEEGVEGVYYTVWNPNLGAHAARAMRRSRGGKADSAYAKHELLNYEHGKVPFVLYLTERRTRRVDDARGYGEVGATWQGQIKAEWDQRIDRSSIATLPPSHYPPGQQPDKWGPGVQVPTQNPSGYGFFEVPGDPRGSREVEESVRQFADEYFGHANDPEHATDSEVLKQKLANGFMQGETDTDTMVLQLCQQFMPDTFYMRVVGSSKGRPIHTSREEIQGKFDLSIAYNMGDLDWEKMEKKLALFGQLLSMDVNGIVDHNEALVMGFEMFDPNAAERLLKPAEAASLAEVEDEQGVALRLLAGVSVPVKPGQAFELRLKALVEFLQTSPVAQRELVREPRVREAVSERVKDLQLQIQQRQNAVIGRGGPAFTPKPQHS